MQLNRSLFSAAAKPFTNAKVVLAAQVSSSVLWLVTISLLARSMEQVSLSQFLYLLAIATGGEALTDAGLRFTVVKLLASETEAFKRARTFLAALLAKSLLSIFAASLILVVMLVGVLKVNDWLQALLVIAVLVTLPSTNPLVWVIRSIEMQWYEGIALILYRTVVMVAVLISRPEALDANYVLGLILAGNVFFALLILWPALKSIGGARGAFSKDIIFVTWAIIRESIGFGMSLVLSQFGARFWVILLGFFSLAQELIAVSTGQMIIQSVLMLGVALGSSYLPYLGKVANSEDASFQRICKAMIVASIAAGVAFGLGVFVAAPIIAYHVFGQEDTQAADILRLLSFLSPIILASFVMRYLLSSIGYGRAEAKSLLFGIVPAILFAPVVLQVGGVNALLVLYIVGEFATLTVKIVAAQRKVKFKIGEFLRIVGTTTILYVSFAAVADSWIDIGRTDVIRGLVVSGITVSAVLATYLLLHFIELRSLWKLNQLKLESG